MTSFQKVIKYGAIAFAIYLCFVIIQMIIFGMTAIFGFAVGREYLESRKHNAVRIPKWEQEYDNVNRIDIELSVCKLYVKKGNTLKVEASDVSNQFECKVDGNRLKIRDENLHKNIFNTGEVQSEIVLYLPETIEFDEIKIETGVNETEIETLKANKVNLVMGVGKYQIDSLFAKYAKIEAGAGEATINNSVIEELKLDGGIGKFIFTSEITKEADINCGIGKMELNFVGVPTDYRVDAESGLGNFVVNHQKVTGSRTLGNGGARIKINAGVGETVVNFTKLE